MLLTRMTRRLLSAILGGFLVRAQERSDVVFMGFPSVRSANKIGLNQTSSVSGDESKEYLCLINRKGGKYYWSSRDNKELSKRFSGDFVIFSAIDGTGYVKFSSEMSNLQIDYMEHLHDHLFTVTYWGKSTLYRP